MIRKDAKLWKTLADSCESPGEFIQIVMRIRGETPATLKRKLGTSDDYIRVTIGNAQAPGVKACLNFANALDIDPYLLNRIASDYKMKKLIEKDELQSDK